MDDFEPDDSYYDDPPEWRRFRSGCVDRMCGAEDCGTCHPENFESLNS